MEFATVMRSTSSAETLWILIVSLVGAIAIVWALVFGAVSIVRIATRHRERMVRLGLGLDPDGDDLPSTLSQDGPSLDGSSMSKPAGDPWDPVTAHHPGPHSS